MRIKAELHRGRMLFERKKNILHHHPPSLIFLCLFIPVIYVNIATTTTTKKRLESLLSNTNSYHVAYLSNNLCQCMEEYVCVCVCVYGRDKKRDKDRVNMGKRKSTIAPNNSGVSFHFHPFTYNIVLGGNFRRHFLGLSYIIRYFSCTEYMRCACDML